MALTPEEKAAAKAAKDAEKAAAKAAKTSATVTLPNGIVRVYDVDTHGEGYADLAKSLADQHPGATIE